MANSLILTKAQNAVTAHDWTTAARFYKELLRGDESNVDYLQQLGSIYVRAGQDEKAIPYYEQIITFNPNNTPAMISLGGIFRRLKRFEESVSILQKAQSQESNSTNINYNLGFTYKEMGDYEDAIDAFESVIGRNPDDVLAHNHLGSIYFAQKEYDKSIAAFKRGLQVDQNHPILNFNLAHVYEDIKNYPESVRCYEIALKTRPGWTEAIRDFSELLIKCQNTKQAQELVEQSIKLHPDDVEMLCILGRIYLNQFDYDNATKTFKRAEQLRGNDINILVGLSKSLEKGTKIDQAMEKILDAVDIAPENIEVCKQYAHVLLSAQRYEKALDLIKTIDSKSDGKDLQILDLYGQYFVCRGDEEAANTYFDKIKKINHHYKDYIINAAERYIQTGNYEKAEEMANSFVERRPQLPEGYNLLGTIQAKRGDLGKAKTEYEKGIHLKNPNIFAVKELEKIYSEMEKNQELYNDTENPIEIDAEEFEAEQKEETAPEEENLTEEEKVQQMDEGDFDYTGLESEPPIEQALSGEDGDFWEDFDDDPDAENKPLVDEEDAYDENSDEDFMTMMTPESGEEAEEPKDMKSELLDSNPDGLDFSDLDDAAAANDGIDDAVDSLAPKTTSPEALEPDVPSEEVYPEPEPEPQPQPQPQPAAPAPDYNDEAMNRLKELEEQQKDFEQQQRDLERQQREFEKQQKDFAKEMKEENEKLIQDAVDKAVEEKMQDFDFQPEEKEPEPVIEEPVIEEPVVEEPVIEEAVAEEVAEPEVEEVAEEVAEPEIEVEPEVEAESEIEAGIDEESWLPETEETVLDESAEEEAEVEEEAETEPEETVEAPAAEEPVIPSDDFDLNLYDDEFSDVSFGDEMDETEVADSAEDDVLDEDFSEDAVPEESEEAVVEELTNEPFVTVEEIIDSCGGNNDLEITESQPEHEISEEDDDDDYATTDDMLEKIERILSDDETAKNYAAEIELFKKLRVLASFMPEKEKNSSFSCRMRMLIEYVIAKMSGKPGLLRTAESLIKSGVLGEEYNRQLEDLEDEELSNDLICRVIKDMKELAQSLEDKELCNALCVSADGILEQIMIINQKSAIF